VRLFRNILSNLATLLFSMLLAIIIWMGASQENDPALLQSFQVPLNLVGQPENSTLDISNSSVVVVVEAPSSVMQTLSPDNFSAVVDLSEVELGEDVKLPVTVNSNTAGVSVNNTSPAMVDLRLEQLVSRDVPVVLDIRGSVARGHTQGEPLIDPQTITVVGTAEQVEPLAFARATVFLNNVRDTFTATPFPTFYNRQGQIASISGLDSVSAESVSVTIPVQESADFAEKIIDVDWSGTPAEGYRLLGINVNPPSALLQGSPSRLTALTQVTTEPIDITGLTETFAQPVTLDLPDGITLDEVQVYTVTVEIEPIFTTAVYNRPVEFQGVAEDMEAIADPEEARVVLFGPLPILDSLTEDEVHVTVDAFGLVTGTYSLEPVVTYPDRGLELRSVQPPLITVEITPTMTNTLTTTLKSSENTRIFDGVKTAASANSTPPASAQPTSSFILPPSSFIITSSFLLVQKRL
jgi:YbbR domain-containing protein